MLVAYGPEGHPVIAQETHFAQLKDWSKRGLLVCPNCREIVRLRGGPEKQIQIHFAHQQSECVWSTESESLRHSRGKKVIMEWLHQQFPQAEITPEKRLPAPNRIADIYVNFPDRRQCAIEFQCAHLEIDEWHRRHNAYKQAGIQDIWIIGSNRREKKDGFIEAILTTAGEVMFIDSLLTPPLFWIRWPVTRDVIREWRDTKGWTPSLEGWVGRSHLKFGATLSGELQEVAVTADGHFIHPKRSQLHTRMGLMRKMREAKAIDRVTLLEYLNPTVGIEARDVVLFPLLQAYLLDPDLLSRYNYGRGTEGSTLPKADTLRIQRAGIWLEQLALRGFSLSWLAQLAQEIPHVGPYTAFANFVEMLVILCGNESNKHG